MSKHLARAEINDSGEKFSEQNVCDQQCLSQNIWAQMQNEYHHDRPTNGEYAFKASRNELPEQADYRNDKGDRTYNPQTAMRGILPQVQWV